MFPARNHALRRDLLLLLALAAVTYFTGLTTRGLSNWQESQRLIVARDMQARGDWLVPTVNGHPYLAKPPLIYWAQLALARPFGRPVGLFELRLAVALAGLLGVLTTYAVARTLFDRAIALWSALSLATGILYVRSSRTGELDILLVPSVVIAVGAVAVAWRSHRQHTRSNLPAVALAAAAATAAALAKGPPGVLVIALAAYGGILAWHVSRPGSFRQRSLALLHALSRTHPVAVLGLPLLALWVWGRLVRARLGADAAAAFAIQEAEDNLRLFVPSAPLRNLEAASYGAGLASVAAVIALLWLLRDRRRTTPMGDAARAALARPEMFIVLAWVVLGLAAFSVLGKGVPRYLTPIWPGIAILGAHWIAAAIATAPERPRRRLALLFGAVVLALALGQAWWYAFGENRLAPERSPRDLVAELLDPARPEALRADPAALATFEFRTPAIDYYAGRFVQPVGDIEQRDSIAGTTPWTIDDLKRHLAETSRPMTLLVRRAEPRAGHQQRAIDRLARAGLVVQTIPLASRFVLDNRRTDVIAVKVSLDP